MSHINSIGNKYLIEYEDVVGIFKIAPKIFQVLVGKLVGKCSKFIISDRLYLELMYWAAFGKRLNLNHPQNFSEKLQWLQLNDRRPEYTMMVDKYAVKDYVKEKIGEEYVVPTIGVWDSVDDVDWERLPDQFVMKTTHDSGSVIICRDKSIFNKDEAIS